MLDFGLLNFFVALLLNLSELSNHQLFFFLRQSLLLVPLLFLALSGFSDCFGRCFGIFLLLARLLLLLSALLLS